MQQQMQCGRPKEREKKYQTICSSVPSFEAQTNLSLPLSSWKKKITCRFRWTMKRRRREILMSLVDYLFLQTLFPSTIRPTGLQILRKYLGRVLLHHHSLDRARVSGGATGAVPTAAAVLSALGALDLDSRILRLQFRVARRGRRRAAAVLEPR